VVSLFHAPVVAVVDAYVQDGTLVLTVPIALVDIGVLSVYDVQLVFTDFAILTLVGLSLLWLVLQTYAKHRV